MKIQKVYSGGALWYKLNIFVFAYNNQVMAKIIINIPAL